MGRIEEGEARLRQSVDQWLAFHSLAVRQTQPYSDHLSASEAWITTELNLAEAEAASAAGSKPSQSVAKPWCAPRS